MKEHIKCEYNNVNNNNIITEEAPVVIGFHGRLAFCVSGGNADVPLGCGGHVYVPLGYGFYSAGGHLGSMWVRLAEDAEDQTQHHTAVTTETHTPLPQEAPPSFRPHVRGVKLQPR